MSQVSPAIRRAQADSAISGMGLMVHAVEARLRIRARTSGLFRAGCDEIAGELSNAVEGVKGGKVWPRQVRAAIEAMALAMRPDGKPFIVWDGRLCVGYFVGHQNDDRPRRHVHAVARENYARHMTSCAPVDAMFAELDPWLNPDVYERKGEKQAVSEMTAANTETPAPDGETPATTAAPAESDSAAMIASLREHLPALPLPEPERMAVGTPLAGKLAARWQSLRSDPERARCYLLAIGRRMKGERLQWQKDGETIGSVASVDIICDDAVMKWLRAVQERARAPQPARPVHNPETAAALAAPAGAP